MSCRCTCIHEVREREWKERAREYGNQLNRRTLDDARELAETWRQNLTDDYWLLVYILEEVAPNLPIEVARRARERMLADGANIRANELRPITARNVIEEPRDE